MAIISCPKCRTQLRVPDGSTAAVRCPKCQTVFSPPKSQPAFEVVDEPAPPKAAKPAPRPASPPPPPPKPAQPAAAAKQADFEFVDDDEPKAKPKRVTARREDDDDEDDDRPRKKRRRDDDDDDDDDRPRSRKRDRDDDDDEDDDRPRKKKRRREYDDDDDWADSGSKKKAGAGAAKVGMLMLSISLWIYAGTFALLGLMMFIALLGASVPSGLLIIPGLLGLANWVTGAIGLGFAIAGPSRSRGLAIAATAVSAVHLVLGFVVANDAKSVLFASTTIQNTSAYNKAEKMLRLAKEAQKNPGGSAEKELQEMYKESQEDEGLRELRAGSSSSKMRWLDLATLFPFSDKLIAVLSYESKLFSDYILGLLAGLTEVARIVLIVLLIGSMANALRAHGASDKAKIGLIGVCIAAGVAMLITLLIAVIIDSSKPSEKSRSSSGSSPTAAAEDAMSYLRKVKNWSSIGELLLFALHGGVLIMPALAAMQVSSVAGSRSRR